MSIIINDRSPRAHYVATSGQLTFQVPFEFIRNADLKVYVNEVLMVFSAPPGNDQQYSTTGENVSGGGSITFGPPGRKLGDKVIIFRDMPIARTADLPTSGVFPVDALNQNLDAETAMIQQTEVNVVQRTLSLSENDFTLTLNKLPKQDARAGRILAFDLNGQPVLVNPGDFGSLGGGSGGTGLFGLIWTGDSPPVGPWVDGQLWWQSSTGHLFLYYGDVDSQQWVQINIGTGSIAQGPAIPGSDAHVHSTLLTASSGNFTMPPAARWYRLRGVGGGGGGGGVQTGLNEWAASSGGGSGGYGESEWFDATGISGGTYTVGRGGTGAAGATTGNAGTASSWNDGLRSMTWNGGQGGRGHSGSASAWALMGGVPGTLSGPLLVVGGNGGGNSYSSSVVMIGGRGGDSPLGQGAPAVQLSSGSVAGNNATVGYGGGGSGAVRSQSGTVANVPGGDGQIGAIYAEVMY